MALKPSIMSQSTSVRCSCLRHRGTKSAASTSAEAKLLGLVQRSCGASNPRKHPETGVDPDRPQTRFYILRYLQRLSSSEEECAQRNTPATSGNVAASGCSSLVCLRSCSSSKLAPLRSGCRAAESDPRTLASLTGRPRPDHFDLDQAEVLEDTLEVKMGILVCPLVVLSLHGVRCQAHVVQVGMEENFYSDCTSAIQPPRRAPEK